MLVLGDQEVSSVLTGLSASNCQRLLDALTDSLARYSEGRKASQTPIHQPLRQNITTSRGHTSLFMPASNTATTGIKVVTLPGDGSTAKGSISIYAPEGQLLGLVNAEEVTAFRTGLASMIPFLRCPFPKSQVVVFGAGKQAEWHIRLSVLLTQGAIQTITVSSRRSSSLDALRGRLDGFCRQYPNLDIRFIAKDTSSNYESDVQAAIQECDAIMCCTPSTEPLFPSPYLSQGHDGQPKQRFISLIGSYKPHMQEVDSETLLSGTYIYVDSKEACLEEAGELIKANVSGERLIEVGEMASQAGLGNLEGNMVYKCVGMGIMDVVVGSELLQIARETNVGRTVDF